MKTPKFLYILIAVFCIFAIIAGVYAQFIEGGSNVIKTSNEKGNVINEKDVEQIKTEFNDLFTNTINLNGFDDSGIEKMYPNEGIVYSGYKKKEETESYDVNIDLPVINIKSEVAKSFNENTNAIFVTKGNEVLTKKDTTTITRYSIDYVGCVNGNILSLAIRSTLKEGDGTQRVMIQTYNYNLSTNTVVKLNDVITVKELNKEDVNKKIHNTIEEAIKQEKAIQEMGYNTVFTRDIENDMYTVDGATTFFFGENKNLYIIYAYGNNNFTSEMDIILYE